MLAEAELISHLGDHPWPGWTFEFLGLPVTLMSSGIAAMVLCAIGLVVLIVPAAQRARLVPAGIHNALDVLVLFVRGRIARPALHENAYKYLPFLLTLFVFVLGLNLMGIVPLEAVAELLHLENTTPIGVTATTVPVICGALASITLLAILFSGLSRVARRCREQRNWPGWLCGVLSPVLWLWSLSPSIPGVTGKILAVPLALLEFVGAVIKCFALMVRLLANMLAGHALVAVLLMFVLQALAAMLTQESYRLLYVGPICILAGVAVSILELLVAGLQAYIFTFLSAMFLGLYAEVSH